MKRWLMLLLGTALCLWWVGCAGLEQRKDVQPQLTIAGSAKLDKEGVLEISGTGFAADQEITLVFVGNDGVDSDIGFALEPPPKAGADGSWQTRWSYGRWVSKKIVSAGTYDLSAYDADFNVLTQTKVTFVE